MALVFLNKPWISKLFSDERYLKIKYYLKMGKKLNLDNPQTFNEKLQWLKLYNRKDEYTMMADKYAVRQYIAEKLGEEYLIPLLGVWDNAEDIDFDALPEQFVLKCTHNSGKGMCICKDKSKLDIDKVRKELNEGLKEEYFYSGREWCYKNIKPRIIAEKYMADDKLSEGLSDYKFMCFNGMAESVMVCLERHTGDTKFYFFNEEWELLRYNIRGINAPEDFMLQKPEKIDEMFELARLLSTNLPFVRVDLYCSYGKVYFGELTFFPDSGFDANILRSTDENFGECLNLEGVL